MKTSILISSFAALYLLVTFAEAPHRRGKNNMTAAPTENITFTTANSVTMLPGPFITAERENTTAVTVPASTDDFSYLKFNVNNYVEAYVDNPKVIGILPETIETDFSYLKFKVGDFNSVAGLNNGVITELPEDEINTINPFENVPVAIQFNYLRFDVNNYISQSGTEGGGIGELPAEELLHNEDAKTKANFSYLKFDVTTYYIPENPGSEVQFELPVKQF